ncbi:hypothetical protein ASPBRDRAFT_201102 [Aspergillus brasiliensis CBS 101740]|uniref:Ryanodine receptor Ryr domain-containing protein n=1 Tax=Aspergillus brasiliensis (strain CBS 101740 / IMI 381727 / IBT 21946) TaxID=767769 RepID=A0A1L9U3E3_ASPBC|nr:hypothetical protein ASPBRDRAFT_201102 [Aspergillus brasiliensis CBS 101740]
MSWVRGGAHLISSLLIAARLPTYVFSLLDNGAPGYASPTASTQFVFQLESAPNTTTHSLAKYRVEKSMKLARQAAWHAPAATAAPVADAKIMILQEAEDGFTDTDHAISWCREMRPDLLVYHMARPLGTGELWDVVRFGPFTRDGTQDPMKLIVVVSADDIRAEGVEISDGHSWEKSCEDFVENLGSGGRLDTVITCAHLIVLFGCDGLIYHRGRGGYEPMLFFDPVRGEGDFFRQNLGPVPGLAETFIAGMAAHLERGSISELDLAIRYGFEAARRLAQRGFMPRNSDNAIDYPVDQIMENLVPNEELLSYTIPSEEICQGSNPDWTILDLAVINPIEVAREIVQAGPLAPTSRIPVAKFRELVLYDRKEIEQFRSMHNLIEEYLAETPGKPLNIALFGPSGSGKSFAAMEVARAACHPRKINILQFNLSQFVRLDDLLEAFSSVRDSTLARYLTLAYFDGFDGDFLNSPLGWLSHLSPCMLSGTFLEKGHVRPIGPAILLFGAGHATNFMEFDQRATFLTQQKQAKGSEFISYLHGFIDVRGPSQCDSQDELFSVRRAVMLRALLEERAPNVMTGGRIMIDEGVLDGLLLVPTFRHGARSMRSLLAMSKLNQRNIFDRLALPSPAQLSLHVDYAEFVRCIDCQNLSNDVREYLAEELHNIYRLYRLDMAPSKEERRQVETEISLAEWNVLREDLRESARAQAADIPRKLRLLSCFLGKSREDHEPVREFTDAEVDILAEKEHERWNAERFRRRWRLGVRNQVQRSSPFLVPWRDLERVWQDLDRELVRSYPTILPEGYCIYRLKRSS